MWRSPNRPPAVVVATWLEGHTRGMAPGVAPPMKRGDEMMPGIYFENYSEDSV